MVYPVPLSSSYCTGDVFLSHFPPQFFICDLVGLPYLEDVAKIFVPREKLPSKDESKQQTHFAFNAVSGI